jgi:hypothetical protein
MSDVTFYKARKSVMGGGLVVLAIVFFGLTLPLIVEGAMIPTTKLLGLISFWVLGLLLTFVPLGAKLEVGKDYIKTYLFNFTTTSKISASEIQVLNYGNVFRGGLGYGKGISFRALKNGNSKAYSISEAIYGKDAVAHAKRVLETR